MPRVLIADDDKEIADLIADVLAEEGIEALIVGDGEAAIAAALKHEDLALIILDIMMPGQTGLEVCRRIRDSVACPILFLTAKNRLMDTVVGLEIGGDDYMTKPFVLEELVARVKAHLRREKRAITAEPSVIRLGKIEVFKARYEVIVAGKPVDFSTREFQVLVYLCENANRVLSKEQIFDAVWGFNYGDVGTVAVHIKNIRDKIGPDHNPIKTVWGVGYKLVSAPDA